jgi:hypothetical protein
MRRLAAALVALFIPAAAQALTVTPDYTDMWWNPQESGWGANVIQQADTIFVTLFIYDGNRNPTWYVAPQVSYQGAQKFSGALYQTHGPWFFQQTFDASTVVTQQVGTLTFEAVTPTFAKLTYDIGGFVIVKDVTRQTWREDNTAGVYLGGRQGTYTSCPAYLPTRVNSSAVVSVTHSGNDVNIRDVGNGYSCTYTGKYRQAGHFAEITGTAVCDDNISRFFTASEVRVSQVDFSMRYRMEQVGTNCVFEGYTGGIRQLP